ncbi:MAG: hypothetical protein JWO59_1373 [Chloroflexi bacterium]|nr:hypothetical protein [Chloroflexota bacterium]
MGIRILLATLITGIAGLSPAVSHAGNGAGQGTFRFDVKIGGKVHDSGSIVGNSAPDKYGDYNGCAIVKQKAGASILGAYTFEIHLNTLMLLPGAGVAPRVDGIYLSVDHYSPKVITYKVPDVAARFAFKGRAYGASVTYSVVQIRNGGRDGTYTDRSANRLYPAKLLHPLTGMTFQASWHCSTVSSLKAAI